MSNYSIIMLTFLSIQVLVITHQYRQNKIFNVPIFWYVLRTFYVPFTYVLGTFYVRIEILGYFSRTFYVRIEILGYFSRTFYVRLHNFLHHIQESYLTLSNQYFCIILVRETYQFDAGFPYALEWQQLQYYTCIPSYFSFQNLKLFSEKHL